jgi:hypothetical protein
LDVWLFVPKKPQTATRSAAAPRRLANGVNAYKIKKERSNPFLFSKIGRRVVRKQAAARAGDGTHAENKKRVAIDDRK